MQPCLKRRRFPFGCLRSPPAFCLSFAIVPPSGGRKMRACVA